MSESQITTERPSRPLSQAPAKVLPPPVRLAGGVGRGLFFIGTIFLLREAQPLVVPIAVAVVFTFVLSPLVRLLRRFGIPEFIGAAILVASLIGVVALLSAMLIGPASQWWERAPASLEELIQQADRLRENIGILAPPKVIRPVSKRSTPVAPPPEDPLKQRLVSESVTLTGLVIGRFVSFGLSTVATVLLLYFLLASEHWLLSRTVEAIQRRRTRALLLSGVRNAQREIGRFIGALSIINVAVGFVTMFVMTYLGLANPVLWGSAAAILNFIPYIGPIIMTGMLILAGVVSYSATPSLILAPALGFMLIHAVESNLVSPWFIGRSLSLSRISVFLSVMFWGWLWGIAGALLAVPILIGIRNACKRIPRMRRLSVYLDESRTPAPSLSSLLKAGAFRGAGRKGAGPGNAAGIATPRFREKYRWLRKESRRS